MAASKRRWIAYNGRGGVEFVDLEYYKITKMINYIKVGIIIKMSLVDIGKDFICGCVCGWVQVFVMQPFEIVKVRLINQSFLNPEYKGIFDCFRKIK